MRIGPDESEDRPAAFAATASFGGVLVDHAGTIRWPTAHCTCRCSMSFNRSRPDQITDAQGHFRFDAVVANLKLRTAGRAWRAQQRIALSKHVDHFYFQPKGEVRDEPRLTVDLHAASERAPPREPRPGAPPCPCDCPGPFAVLDRAACILLVLLQGDDSDRVEQLSGRVLDWRGTA